MFKQQDKDAPLNIVVAGASGDLARKKIFPALFALFSQGLLPEQTMFFGFARSNISRQEFQDRIMGSLTCRYTPDHSCQSYIDKFLERCHYVNGEYDSTDSFLDLYSSLMIEGCDASHSNCLFYLAIPPAVFVDVARAIGNAGLVYCGENSSPWSRVVVEKPFGKDRESSDKLVADLSEVFDENQIYRIDHYLGKEIVQNLLAMRFANQIFKPIWNAEYIEKVDIVWQETQGTEGRGGYFDNYGIIRDVVQNHLLQILALTAMEEPASLSAKDIRDGKVEVLSRISPVAANDIRLGQYVASGNGKGYTDDPSVPDDSITPTFAEVKLNIDMDRWRGTPFTIRAGKGLDRKLTEVRIVFKAPATNIFCNLNECPPANELVIRVQPDEGIHFKIINKEPGFKMRFHSTELALSYKSAFSEHIIPEAYECLLLDVINGDKSLFIRKDELAAAWDIFTPALHEMAAEKIKPEPYPFGSEGPASRTKSKCGCKCGVAKKGNDGKFNFFECPSEMRRATADLILEKGRESIAQRGVFSMVISGGETPLPLFAFMAEKSYADSFPWSRTHIFWSDERCVPMDDENSNYGKAFEALLSKVPLPGENIHRIKSELSPEEAAAEYEKELLEFFEKHPDADSCFDFVLLGMGADGHTASLFPGSEALSEKERLVVSVPPPVTSEPKVSRATLTYPALCRSREVLFLISGKDKVELLEKLNDKYPAARVRSQGNIKWHIIKES